MSIVAKFDFDGANGSTTLADGATPANTATCFGSAALSTTQFAQGSASLRMPGVNSAYAKVTASGSTLTFTGDFTIAFRLYRDSAGTSQCAIGNPDGSLSLNSDSSGALYWHVPGANTAVYPAQPGRFVSVALIRIGTTIKAFFDNYLHATVSGVSGSINFNNFEIGRNAVNGLAAMAGYFDQLQINNGDVLFNVTYDPDTLTDIAVTGARSDTSIVVAKPFAPVFPMREFVPAIGSAIRDMAWGGKGQVSGTVKVKGSPNFPKYARTRLFNEIDGTMIREQWSNPLTGAYSFDNVDERLRYTVVAYDHDHNFRAVVADNLTPSLMP